MLTRRKNPLRSLAPIGVGLLTVAMLASGCLGQQPQISNAQARSAGLGGAPAVSVQAPRTTSASAPASAPATAKTSESTSVQPAAAVREATITARDLKFDISNLTVQQGQTVKLTLNNQGAIEHDWEVPGLKASDVQVVAKSAGETQRQLDIMTEKAKAGIVHLVAGAGQQVTVQFTPAQSGSFDVLCTIPGHKEAGMSGKLVVLDPSGKVPAGAMMDSGKAGMAGHDHAMAVPIPGNIGKLQQPKVAEAVGQRAPQTVRVELEAKEVTALMDDGVAYNYWTFNGTVPAPMIRVRQGDRVVLTLKNAVDSKLTHSIDLHAVTGPGGGAKFTQVAPGESAQFEFNATNPGVYVYHCATAPIPQHISNGMYGLVVVEPPEGLPQVDHEFYVMQGDFYFQGARADKGVRQYAPEKALDEKPDYVVFNGSVGALTGENALKAKVGDTVRIFFGVGGPNITSSFHVIGEIFDRVAQEGASQWQTNVQTTLVPAGGATVAEFQVQYPGDYMLVDHSLSRLEKGAMAVLHVDGPENPEIFKVISAPAGSAAASGH